MSGSFVHKIIIAGCRCFDGPLASGPHQRDTMTTKDHEVQSVTFRRLLAAGLVAILPVAVILAVLITREDGQVTRSTLAPSSTAATPTTTTIDTRTEVTHRLVEILKIRDRALKSAKDNY
jgi:hypothetical protein